MKVYNTLGRKKEVFEPIQKNKVNIFVCGPTVYDYPHIGHAKTYVQFDIIVRYLRYKKYEVFYLQNITDIDDKIINRAREKGITEKELAEQFTKIYFEDMKALKVESVNKYAKATDHIKEIIDQIKRLMEKGYAYETSDGVYYEVSKFKEYGKLSHQKIEEILAGARVEVNEDKKHPADFALWKKEKPGEPSWDSPWGKGRPGWHIEDTAITEKYFGPQYDIHGGAIDLIFPHHEAEIAQMEAISGKKPLVRYWMHTGFLRVDGVKMSKSLGNFITIRDVLKKWDPEVLRLFFASAHYRSPIDFSEKNLEQAKANLDYLYNTLNSIEFQLKNVKGSKDITKDIEGLKNEFIKAMDDDFNTPLAISKLLKLANLVNKELEELDKKSLEKALETFRELGKIFGILEKESVEIPKEILDLVEEREKARKNKDWETADKIRELLRKKGYEIGDSKEGPIIKKINF